MNETKRRRDGKTEGGGDGNHWCLVRFTRYTVLSTPYFVLGTAPAVFVFVSACPNGAQAQTLLRWKLKPGDAFTVDTRQETESQVAFSGKSVTTTIDLALQQ